MAERPCIYFRNGQCLAVSRSRIPQNFDGQLINFSSILPSGVEEGSVEVDRNTRAIKASCQNPYDASCDSYKKDAFDE